MEKKVILITIDGMRPDGLLKCGNAFVDEMMKRGTYTLEGKSVIPPVTLPCHVSIFKSVPPEIHGTTTNIYTKSQHKILGLCSVVKQAGGNCGMYYGWGPMRNLAPACSLKHLEYIWAYAEEHTDALLTDSVIHNSRKFDLDFVFLHLVETDEKGGHDNGWMSEPYLQYIKHAINNVKRILDELGNEYTIIVIADHGGHDHRHRDNIPEDMTVPMFFFGPDFKEGEEVSGITLLDIAPTIVDVMGIPAATEWQGKSILKK